MYPHKPLSKPPGKFRSGQQVRHLPDELIGTVVFELNAHSVWVQSGYTHYLWRINLVERVQHAS